MKKFTYEIDFDGPFCEKVEREVDLFELSQRGELEKLIVDCYGETTTSYQAAHFVDVMTADGDSLGSISLSSIDIELPRKCLKRAWREAVERSKGLDRPYSVVTDGDGVWYTYSGGRNFLICKADDYGVTEPADITDDLIDMMLADLSQQCVEPCEPCVCVSAV